jgi:quercetin dioxygenase-like cupin family protein
MPPITHADEPLDQWRPGVQTRMLISARNGAASLCLFEQFVDPGHGAPTHRHSVEEVLTVLAGTAEVWLADDRMPLATGQSVIVPAGIRHGFTNTGTTTLHVHALLAAPFFEATFDDRSETTRRWQPA